MAKPFDERIRNALTNPRASIAEIDTLIIETDSEIERQSALASQHNDEAIDLALSETDRHEAAGKGDKAARNVVAYQNARAALVAKADEKRQSERQQSMAAERKAALAERDALAETLAATYPRVANELAAIFDAIAHNNERMARAGLGNENGAEQLARGLSRNFQTTARIPSYLESLLKLKLPAFNGGERLWPKPITFAQPDYIGDARKAKAAIDDAAAAELSQWQKCIVRHSIGQTQCFPVKVERNGPIVQCAIMDAVAYDDGPPAYWIHQSDIDRLCQMARVKIELVEPVAA